MRRAALIAALSLVVLSGCATINHYSPLARLERGLLYQPQAFPAELENRAVPFEEVQFTSADGVKLHGWYAGHPEPTAVALFCHGNAGNMVSRGNTLAILNQRHRLAVMMFDYRGYGKSECEPFEEGVLADARAARTWLSQRTHVPESEILLMGRSLGGAVAVDLAQDGARGLVLASTFASLPAVAGNAFPFLPTSLLMTERFNSLRKIKKYQGPLLQSHGDADQLIPLEQAQKLFAAAPGKKKTFIVIPGANHNDPQSDEYRDALDAFLREL
ncbi:alpha/beta hydrolase [Lignipirellula cremea]|uniref:Alpha/beta hydrolase family protein n=1 Tax=Lignipirellula cremea TaxID=2528010 RepID=A0A518E1N4_9BACT|nr:alpha/beta hydrolase [Lignipirellula cremea]QDU97981.1 Alpha/beta hydrolase family protein [Lignipirellula cremea]